MYHWDVRGRRGLGISSADSFVAGGTNCTTRDQQQRRILTTSYILVLSYLVYLYHVVLLYRSTRINIKHR